MLFVLLNFQIITKTASLFKPPHLIKTIFILFIMFALCFGYYGLWIWLPELYKRMAQNGGSPCSSSSSTNFTVITNKTASCHIENGVFLSSFYSALSNLPGNLFTIIFIDKMGRNLVTCKYLNIYLIIEISINLINFYYF